MYDVKNLLEKLIDFSSGGEAFTVGRYDGVNNQTMFEVVSVNMSDKNLERARQNAINLINLAIRQDMDNIDAILNFSGLDYAMLSAPFSNAPGVLVPTVTDIGSVPNVIFALARITDSGNGECLASKITKCGKCEKIFIAKTKRRSRFCSPQCRTEFVNQERRNVGYFKQYYRNKKLSKNNL